MTKFTKSILKFILPIASLGFFLIASIIVLVISQGRKIDDDGSIIQTGIIRVTSIPTEGVKAYINGSEVSYSDFRITGITAGVVTLKLTKDGYTPWEKQIKVDAGIVKDVYAQLYPNTIPFSKITDANINKTFYSEDGQYIYYTQLNGTSLDGIWRLKLTRNLLDFSTSLIPTQIVKFTHEQAVELTTADYKLHISNDNSKVILEVNGQFYLYNLTDTSKRTDLSDLIGTKIENVQWFKNSESIVFTQDNKYSFEYDLGTKQISLIDYNADGLSNIAISGENLFYIKNFKLMQYTNKASAEYKFSDKLKTVIPAKLSQVYTPSENQNVIVLSAETTLVYIDTQKEFLDVIDTNSTFNKILSNGRLLTYLKNDNLYSFYAEDNFNANTLDTYNYNLGVSKDMFTNVEFAATGKNIVIFNNNKITLMDYDGLNSNAILSEFNVLEDQVLFASNSTEIYALIQEKDTTTGSSVNSIYKFELKLK